MADVSETTRIVVERKEDWDRVKGNIEQWVEKAVQARLSQLDAEDPAGNHHKLKREVRVRVQNVSQDTVKGCTRAIRTSES